MTKEEIERALKANDGHWRALMHSNSVAYEARIQEAREDSQVRYDWLKGRLDQTVEEFFDAVWKDPAISRESYYLLLNLAKNLKSKYG